MHMDIFSLPMTPAQAIDKLQRAGMTEAAIASQVGVLQSTVNRIKHGRDPHWSLGNALVRLAQAGKRASSDHIRDI